jgi:hypothetical protein
MTDEQRQPRSTSDSASDWEAWIPVPVDLDAVEYEIVPDGTRRVGLAPPDQPAAPALTTQPQVTAPAVVRVGRDSKRLAALTDAIALYPNSAANYVLRGELYAKHGEYALAEADFLKALSLAESELASEDWGFVAQTVQDRAEYDLRRLRRR